MIPKRWTWLICGLCAATIVVAFAPGPLRAPIRSLAAYDGEGPDPRWDVSVDGPALRRAGRILPDNATYALFAPRAEPLLLGNLKAATQLFFAPALPVYGYGDAGWLLIYHAGRAVPRGVSARRVIRVGRDVYLVEAA